MKIFFRHLFKQRPCLRAVDIGTYEIKLIELRMSRGVPRIHKYASIATPPPREGTLAEEAIAQVLASLTELAGVKGKEVITAISGARVITRQIKIPFMEERDLEDTVKSEAARHIPLPVEDLTLRYVKLGQEKEEGTDQLNIMLIAVPTALVEQYYHIFFMAGLTPKAIDLQAFGLWRLFGRPASPSILAIFDIGITYSQVLVLQAGEIKFLRGITLGSNAGIHNLALELKRSLDYYCGQRAEETIERVILTGGGSKIKGVESYLSNSCGIPIKVEIPTCWQVYGKKAAQDLPYDPSYAVPLGLALREVDV
ncbi:type IV pilus biogenesis protein PilM [Desulfotomaculum sp. 1211_IL3151]|uniref:type IV pilus biogenesis protein PilM n=1 Tax=Desulfotomaculum sp. 1211_IL3151 TaxID=3084055 RepID=UPI002FDB3C38